jgi:two-component system cell cycle sensor histidine kinase/response regulator CckA
LFSLLRSCQDRKLASPDPRRPWQDARAVRAGQRDEPAMDELTKLRERVVELESAAAAREQELAALRQGVDSYRGLLDSVSDAIYVLDRAGTFLAVNDGAVQMYGRPREWLVGKSPASVSAPGRNDMAEVAEKVGKAYDGEAQQLYFWGERSSGEPFLKNVRLYAGTYFGERVIIAVAQDITEEKAAEERLRESEERYRLLTQTSPNSITVVDPAGNVLMSNQRALDVFQHPDNRPLVGVSVLEWVAPEERDKAARALQSVLEGGTLSDFEVTLLRSGGDRFSALVNASLVRDRDGLPQFVIVVSTDITERRNAEIERLHTQKLESIGVLAGGIAHDFNNLLQGVFGYVSLAKMNIDRPEVAAAMIEQAEHAITTSVNLTGQLLTFAKGGSPVKKPTVVAPVIDDAARFALSGSRSNYDCTIAQGLWKVEADEGQLAQVIQNIVLNASEAMPDGGTVKIDARNSTVAPGTRPSLPAGGRFIQISIRDTGIGIPEQHLSRIFDPYFTTKHTGSGLGLATSYSIIRNHNGAIEVASTPGAGSTFTIYVPAGQTESASEVRSPGANSDWKGRILVMDDEEIVRSVALNMLRHLGHEAVAAQNGEEAIEKFKDADSAGRPFDVVILDLTVKGGMGGDQAVAALLKIDPLLKAVVSSGYADNQVVSDFAAHGFTAALNKPYKLERLRECLASCAPE